MVLENGKWTELAKIANAQATDQATEPKDEDEEETPEKVDVSKLDLPYEPHHLNWEYRRETGSLVYTVLPAKDRFKRIMLVLSKPVKSGP